MVKNLENKNEEFKNAGLAKAVSDCFTSSDEDEESEDECDDEEEDSVSSLNRSQNVFNI